MKKKGQGRELQFNEPKRRRRATTKRIVTVAGAITSTQSQTNLFQVTYPCKITGLRWNLTISNIDDFRQIAAWLIIVLREGDTVNSISLSEGSQLYQPQENVIAYGLTFVDQRSRSNHSTKWKDSTKATRQLQSGDTLFMINVSDRAEELDLIGAIQFFVES